MASMEPRQNTSDHTFGDVFSTIPSAQQQNNGMNVNSAPVQSADNNLGHPDDQVLNRIMAMYSNSSANNGAAFHPHETHQQASNPVVTSPPPVTYQTHHQQVAHSEPVHQHVSAPSTPVLTQQTHQVSQNLGSAPALPSHTNEGAKDLNQKEVSAMIEQLNVNRQQQHQQLLQHINSQATQPISALTNQNREMMVQMQMYFERITRFMEGVERRLNNLENVTSEILKAQSRDGTNVPIEKSFSDKREFDAVRRAAEQYERDAELAKKLQQQFEADSRTTTPPPPVQQRPLSISTPTMTQRPTPLPVQQAVVKSPHSNEHMESCPICGTPVVVSLLQDHVNECLDGSNGANGAKNVDPAQQGSLWKRIFGGKKDDETATPTPKPAEPLPLPPISPPPTQSNNSLYPGTHSPPVVRPPPSLYGQPGYPGYPSFNSGYPQQQAAPAYPPQNQGYYYYAVPPGK